MTDLNPDVEDYDDLGSAPATPQSGRNVSVKVILGMAAIFGSVIFFTSAINSDHDGGSLGVAAAKVAIVESVDAPSAIDSTDAEMAELESLLALPMIETKSGEPLVGAAWRVQLVSLRDLDNAKTAWSNLQRSYEDLLAGLEMNVQLVELSSGTFYRVQAGPFADRATAASLCNSLKTRRQDCLIVAP